MPQFERDSQVLEIGERQRVGLAVFGASDGIPVLALHGTPASRFMFKIADTAAAKRGLTLYCPERPGYGLSDPPSGRETAHALKTRTDELVQMVDALGLERFIVLGVSGGAPYAVSLAYRLGTRVRGLALVSPMGPIGDLPLRVASKLSFRHRLLFQKLVKWPWVLRSGASVGAGFFDVAPKLFTKVFGVALGSADRGVLSKVAAQTNLINMTREAVRNGMAGAVSDLDVFSQPWGVDFGEIIVSSVLWTGTADRLVPVVSSVWLGAQLPGCEVVKLEGAGHFWVLEEIDAVLERVARLAEG